MTSKPEMIAVCPKRRCGMKENAEDRKFDDSSAQDQQIQLSPAQPTKSRANSTGLKTQSGSVNAGFSAVEEGADPDFEHQYAKLIMGEIGQDVVDSQKQYIKYVPTDASLRMIDRDIETNYANYSGLSISRLKKPQVNASNSTQIQGIEVEDFNRNVPGSIRGYTQGL